MPSLHNLQLFVLPHVESLARASTTSARLYFFAGPRLIEYLGSTHGSLSATAATFSCGLPAVPERVEQVVEDRKRATKRVDDLEAELARMLVKDMLASTAPGDTVTLYKQRADDSSNPLGFLSSISMAFSNEISSREQPTPHLVVLSSSPSSQNSTSTTVVMVFGSDEKRVKEVGDVLRSKLGVKGGGKGPRWSGKFTGVWKANKEGALIEETIRV